MALLAGHTCTNAAWSKHPEADALESVGAVHQLMGELWKERGQPKLAEGYHRLALAYWESAEARREQDRRDGRNAPPLEQRGASRADSSH